MTEPADRSTSISSTTQTTSAGITPPTQGAAVQDGNGDDGHSWFARLVGAILLIAPLLLVYLLIALWPRPAGSIICKTAPGQKQAQAPASQARGGQGTAAAPATGGAAAPTGAGSAADNTQTEEQREQWAPCASIRPFREEFPLAADVRLLILVLLAGGLGAYVHAGQSYASYMGNREFKKQWTWWYILRIPVGSVLALFVYFTARGGLITGTTPTSRTDDVNIFGIMAIAALSGLFSKQVIDKLAEVFDNFFRSEQNAGRKDKMADQKTTTQKTTTTTTVTPGGAAGGATGAAGGATGGATT
jgi:hypothetical protein